MRKIQYKGNGQFNFKSIECEEDLKLVPKVINIDPPPQDGRCECCLKHLSELKKYDGEFSGSILVKNSRPTNPAYDAFEFYSDTSLESDRPPKGLIVNVIPVLIKGPQFLSSIASWECRDCAGLSSSEYLEKVGDRSNLVRDSYFIVWINPEENSSIFSKKLCVFTQIIEGKAIIFEYRYKDRYLKFREKHLKNIIQ